VSQSLHKNKRSLCFVAFDAVSLIFPDGLGSIGGAETQVVLMARALAMAPEVRVIVVVRDSRPRPVQNVDGFTVVTRVDRLFRIRRFFSEHVSMSGSFPWLSIRRWHPSLVWQIPLLFAANLFGNKSTSHFHFDWLTETIDSEVFCCTGTSERTANVFEAARKQFRRTVLFVVSDADLDERYINVPGFVNKYGDVGHRCVDSIRNADLIACQTVLQQRMLADRFGRDSIIFPNPFDHEDWKRRLETGILSKSLRAQIPPRFVLWIGRSERHHKRPELLLQVAGACPHVRFVMVMNTHDEIVAAEVRRKCPANVEIIERVPFGEIPCMFRQSAMFISTGSKEFEGFPNVFLQAAASSVPIVTLEADPGFIAEHHAGIVCDGDIAQMAREVARLWDDSSEARSLGLNGKKYVILHHSATDTRRRLLELMDAVL